MRLSKEVPGQTTRSAGHGWKATIHLPACATLYTLQKEHFTSAKSKDVLPITSLEFIYLNHTVALTATEN